MKVHPPPIVSYSIPGLPRFPRGIVMDPDAAAWCLTFLGMAFLMFMTGQFGLAMIALLLVYTGMQIAGV